MKKILLALGALLLTLPLAAQQDIRFAGALDAYNFAYGIAPGAAPLTVLTGAGAGGTYTVTLIFGQTTAADGSLITPIATNVPVLIGTGAAQETVTPSSVSCSSPAVYGTCSFTATFSNAHGQGDLVRSGTFGLQEAALKAVQQGGGLVLLGPQWFSAEGGHSTGITALTGQKSLATSTYSVLDYSGIAGVFSYAAASGSNYASTTHVLY